MARAAASGSPAGRLGTYLFDDPTDTVAREVNGWLAGSPRFRAFAEKHREKIRKKLRGAADTEARLDVRAELRVAHLLLADPRIDLGFEARGSAKGGPDFTVALRGQRTFNLEVTRLHRAPAAVHAGPLVGKLRQLPPSSPNVLLVAIEAHGADAFDVARVARALRARADAKDEAFFVGRGFDGTRAFYRRYLRLGAVLVWCEGAAGDARAAEWSNGSARIPVPDRALRACLACLRAG